VNELAGSSVVILRWPGEADELERLRTSGIPRLLVVSPEDEPPVDGDPITDWIRMPVADVDLWARVRSLELRSANTPRGPELPGDGRLVMGDRWIAVSPTWERMLGVLVAGFGEVTAADELQRAAWGAGRGSRERLRVQIAKLRRAVRPLGLAVVVVRDRGYVLQANDGSHLSADGSIALNHPANAEPRAARA
jgi:DNA-binding winged helix-turn-helix (wHTH) protein